MDKVESFLRKLLARLGEEIDRKLAPIELLEDLISRLEDAIESGARQNVAPNQFKVLLPYEEFSRLSEQYRRALAEELEASAREFMDNRRYVTRGPVSVEIECDLFSNSASVKAVCKQAAQLGLTVRLKMAGGGERELVLEAGQAIAIGRGYGCRIRIDDPSVSRVHCSIALSKEGELIIADLGSANGTFVNGERIAPGQAHRLNSGDELKIGDMSLTLIAEKSPV
jgi:hypothetical protein